MSTNLPGPDNNSGLGNNAAAGSSSSLGASAVDQGGNGASSLYATSPEPDSHSSDDRSLGEIIGDIANDFSALMRQELDLAKREAKAEASKAGKAGGMFGGAAIAALLMLIFVSLALTYLLDNVMPVELAALIVGLVWAIAAGVLAMAGKKQLQSVNPALETTQRSLKEDAKWAKTQKSS